MNCPRCGSDNIRTFKVVYEEGTYKEKTKSSLSGSGRYVSGTSETSGKSELANKCSPPQKQSSIIRLIVGLVFSFVIFFILVVIFIDADADTNELTLIEEFIIFGALIILSSWAIILAIKAYIFNKNVYPKMMKVWRNSWICMKCGELYCEDDA